MEKSGGNNGGTKSFTVSIKLKTQCHPKAKQSTKGTSNSHKTTLFVGTNKVSTLCYNKESQTNKDSSCSLSNSFKPLNDENLISEEVATDSKASTSVNRLSKHPPAHNMNSHIVKMNWRELFPSITDSEHWHQSLKPGKHRNTLSQMEFMRRKIKRGKEEFAPCARQITKECKAMLRNKIEQINLFNSTLSSRKFRKYTCFYCTRTGHVAKSCPTKLDDEQFYARAGAITFRHGDEATRARIKKNKESEKGRVEHFGITLEKEEEG
nr:ARID DNA-binding domain-containing protein [Tanacetum cinerariifolium]